jgi:2-oxoglutarate ferredoxin oxidoreductase subunit beta
MVDGQPIKSSMHGVVRNGSTLEIVELGSVDESQLVIHDSHNPDPSYAFALSRLSGSELSHVPVGVFRDVVRPGYSSLVHNQLDEIIKSQGAGDLEKLLHGGDTWVVN